MPAATHGVRRRAVQSAGERSGTAAAAVDARMQAATARHEKESSTTQGRQMLPQPGRVHQRVCGSRSARSATMKSSNRESIAAGMTAATSARVTPGQGGTPGSWEEAGHGMLSTARSDMRPSR